MLSDIEDDVVQNIRVSENMGVSEHKGFHMLCLWFGDQSCELSGSRCCRLLLRMSHGYTQPVSAF
jgi:hypothetical protein